MTSPIPSRLLASVYLQAKREVIDAGFGPEIDWQADVDFAQVTEAQFLREGAWTILCAGMREAVIRGRFGKLSNAFLGWGSARDIVDARRSCRRRALAVFNHAGKVGAILNLAHRVASLSFDWIRAQVSELGVAYLRRFPFFGPVTSFHLAKNIGLPVAKPDRHLARIAHTFGFSSVQDMCGAVSSEVLDSIPVVDVVFWRYATIHSDYRARLKDFASDS